MPNQSTSQLPSAHDASEKPIVNFGVIASVAVILVGLGMAVMSAMKLVNLGNSQSGSGTETVEGTITKVRTRTADETIICQLVYYFDVNGQRYTSTDDSQKNPFAADNCNMAQGQIVTVHYNPQSPSDNSASASSSLISGGTNIVADIAMVPISLILIGIGIYALNVVKRSSRNEQLDISDLTEANLLSQTRNDVRYK